MSLESFYGGKQGLSSIIKKSFKYISDTDPAFTILNSEKQAEAIANNEVMAICLSNPDYKDVWYGELCLIDTTNKNNPYNGYLYRRTLAKTGSEDPSSTAGTKLPAEYIGQIVGPAGSALQLESMKSITNAQNDFGNLNLQEGDSIIYVNQNGVVSSSINSGDSLGTLDITVANGGFIPGNTIENNHYIDSGKYTWYNTRLGSDEEDRSRLHIGFQLPYHISEFVAGQTLSPGSSPTLTTVTSAPFYKQYAINVPRGLRGAWLDNIRWEAATKTSYSTLNSLSYDDAHDSWQTLNTHTVSIGATIWLADFHYTTGNSSNVVENLLSLYIADYKTISSVEIGNDNHLYITYSDNTTSPVDLGLVKSTQEGLYVRGTVSGVTISNASSPFPRSAIETAVQTSLNSLTGENLQRAQVVDITFEGDNPNTTQSLVFYYDTSTSNRQWKLLDVGGSGGGGAANSTDIQINFDGFPKNENQTGKPLDINSGIVFDTTSFSITSLPTAVPWK